MGDIMEDSPCNSHTSLNIYTNEYRYPVWFSKKKHYFYKNIEYRLKKFRYIHNRASEYFSKLQKYILGPSIVITSISGIASFLSTSDTISDTSQNSFGIAVGILAAIATLLQTVSGTCKFATKAECHRVAAEEYNKLLTRIKFEMEMPNEEDFTDKLEANILDIQNNCKFFPPQFILNEWARHKNSEKPKPEYIAINSLDNENRNRENPNININIDTDRAISETNV